MSREPSDLIYAPATRGNIGVLIMIAGPSGSGKTLSALRVATGLANGGPIYFCDTEHGRARIYAEDFSFEHLPLKEPFSPDRFEQAAVVAQRAGASVWICDSFTHEHVGPGGVLDMFEAEIEKMTRGDVNKREQLKYAAWIKPKVMHKHLVQRLWQLNCHIILCCHGEKKLDLVKNDRGKMVPNPDAGLSAVCSPDLPFAMTASFMLELKRPGVPLWMKHLNKWDALIDVNRPLDEATGARIGAWARGEDRKPVGKSAVKPAGKPEPEASKPEPASANPAPEGKPEGKREETGGPPDDRFPLDIPLGGELPLADNKKPTVGEMLADFVRRFEAVKVRSDHLAIVDVKENRDRIAWLKKNHSEAAGPLKAAMQASWDRTELQRETAA